MIKKVFGKQLGEEKPKKPKPKEADNKLNELQQEIQIMIPRTVQNVLEDINISKIIEGKYEFKLTLYLF